MSVDDRSQLSFFIDHMDESSRTDQLRFFRLVDAVGEGAAQDLGPRFMKSVVTREMRLLVTEAAFYHPWPDWQVPLVRMLRYEMDLEIFDVGVQALARMGAGALASMKDLYNSRHAEEFQEILSRELLKADPKGAFRYHFQRLLEGSSNPKVANEAAAELAKFVDEEAAAQLKTACTHSDILIARHALKLMTRIQVPETAQFLLALFRQTHAEVLEERELKESVSKVRQQTGPAQLEAVMALLGRSLGARRPDLFTVLQEGAGQGGPAVARAYLEARGIASGRVEVFLLDALELFLRGTPNKIYSLVAQTAEGSPAFGRRSTFVLDTCALGLTSLMLAGMVDSSEVLNYLTESFAQQTGREGVARSLGQILEPSDRTRLELILTSSDSSLRGAALDAIGERGDSRFHEFLLKACQDPIIEIGQRAMASIGRLPEALETTRNLLVSVNPEEVRLGCRIAAVNRMLGAVPFLMELIETAVREDLSLEGIQAVGAIGGEDIHEPLLRLLHNGQSARMQNALATALKDLERMDATLALAQKAIELRSPQLHALAAEALIQVSNQNPLDSNGLRLLKEQFMACWSDRSASFLRPRLIQALEKLRCSEASGYEEMSTMVQTALKEKSGPASLTMEQQLNAQAVVRELARRIRAQKEV